MFDFSTNVSTVEQQITANAAVRQQYSETLNSSETSDSQSSVEIENAQLADVQRTQVEFNDNIVNMIMGLEDVTNSFGSQFESMKSRTWQESFVGMFSKGKSESMRADRINQSSIADNLQSLITQTEKIDGLLSGHLNVLEVEFEKGKNNLTFVVNDAQAVTQDLETVKGKMSVLDPKMMKLEGQLSNAVDATERAALDTEYVVLNNEFNELKTLEAQLLAKSQSRERHIKTNQTHVDSLNDQIAAQKVLIEKLRIDNEQRVITYAQYEQSIKTSEQQEVAHKINEIGSEVDLAAQTGMAQIGAATNNRLMGMMEQHGVDIKTQRDIMEKKKRADERFLRRFNEVAKQHDSGEYTQKA